MALLRMCDSVYLYGAKLLPTTVSVYPVDCVNICHSLKTQHYCLCPNGRYNLPLAAHPLTPPILSPYSYVPLVILQ